MKRITRRDFLKISGLTLGGLAFSPFLPGLTDFDDSFVVRMEEDTEKQYVVRLEDLIKRGDIKANARVLPGDVLIIPEALF